MPVSSLAWFYWGMEPESGLYLPGSYCGQSPAECGDYGSVGISDNYSAIIITDEAIFCRFFPFTNNSFEYDSAADGS